MNAEFARAAAVARSPVRLTLGWLCLVNCVAGGLMAVWARPTWAQQEAMNESDLPARAYAVLGAPIFADNCASCHGAAGAGDGPVLADAEHGMIDFGAAGALTDRAPADWYRVTRDGCNQVVGHCFVSHELIYDAVLFSGNYC